MSIQNWGQNNTEIEQRRNKTRSENIISAKCKNQKPVFDKIIEA